LIVVGLGLSGSERSVAPIQPSYYRQSTLCRFSFLTPGSKARGQ
jgi:hypothetical protein